MSAIVNEYGAKNLLKIVRYVANGYNFNGVIITYNDDGSITCVGRSTAVVSLQISDNIYLDPNKQYIISGTTTGSSSTYFLQYSNNRDSAISIKTEEIVFTPYNYTTYPNQTAYIHIKSGVDINTTFYPMIRDANIKDNTFVPYAMSNRELTERVSGESTNVSNCYFYKHSDGSISVSGLVELPMTIPEGFRPTGAHYAIAQGYKGATQDYLTFFYNGLLTAGDGAEQTGNYFVSCTYK